MEQIPTDYCFMPSDAVKLMYISLLPVDDRVQAINDIIATRGEQEVANLFAHFIGLSNSVALNGKAMAEMVLISYGGVWPHEAEKVNMPTIYGALNGCRLLEGVDPEKVCGGCAFRKGTCANQSASTTIDADLSADGEHAFYCHEFLDDKGEPTRKCTGFTQSKARRNKLNEIGGE